MDKLIDLIETLLNLDKYIYDIMGDIIIDNDAIIIEMNIQNQLYDEGINSEGVTISDYQPYTRFTIKIKQAKGQPTSRVTLKDEGDFYSSVFVEVETDRFIIKASDWKTEELKQKYGDQILGLTKENIAKLISDIIKPQLIERIRKILDLDL